MSAGSALTFVFIRRSYIEKGLKATPMIYNIPSKSSDSHDFGGGVLQYSLIMRIFCNFLGLYSAIGPLCGLDPPFITYSASLPTTLPM